MPCLFFLYLASSAARQNVISSVFSSGTRIDPGKKTLSSEGTDEGVLFLNLFQRLGHVSGPNRLDLFDVDAEGGWRVADASGDEVLDAAKEANAEQVRGVWC